MADADSTVYTFLNPVPEGFDKQQKAPYHVPDTIPEGVCNPVMQAEDYDVVNVAFLSPDDTEYNTDTEGMFARGEVTYTLGETDDSYLEDALFIGDSRTSGLAEYGSMMDHTRLSHTMNSGRAARTP